MQRATNPSERARAEDNGDRLVSALIAVAVFVSFLPALRNGFVSWDDEKNFLENTAFRGLGAAQLRWMWTTTLLGHYVPLSWMSLGLDYVVWGMNPAGYHLTNVLLHATNAVLLYYVARRLLRSARGAFADEPRRLTLAAASAALLWALHPLRVESVAWVTERRDVLSYLFFLASLLSYLRSLDNSPTRVRWYTTAVGLFLCAVLSKATSITLPAMLVVINAYPMRRLGGKVGWWSEPARSVYAEILPFGLIAVAAAVLALLALHPPEQLPIGAKLAVSAYSLVFYACKTVAPVRLSPLYDLPQRVEPLQFRFLACYGILAAVAVYLWMIRHKGPAVTAFAVAFVLLTLPMLGIVQNGPQIAADRYTYYAAPALSLPAAGYLFSLPWALRRTLVPAMCAALVAIGSLTWSQTEIWHDSGTLWAYALRLNENSSIAHVGLAKVAFEHGDMAGAVQHYRRAVELDPTYDEGFNNLGNALARQGNLSEAGEAYRHALALNPRYAEAHNDLGSALVQQGRVAEGIDQFRAAVALNPAYAAVHNNWGAALARIGDLLAAIDHYRRAVLIDSAYADAYANWGNALVRLGKPEASEKLYDMALRLRPDDADTHRNLGVALAQQGRMAEAAEHFRRGLALRPDDEELKAYLARATASARGRE